MPGPRPVPGRRRGRQPEEGCCARRSGPGLQPAWAQPTADQPPVRLSAACGAQERSGPLFPGRVRIRELAER